MSEQLLLLLTLYILQVPSGWGRGQKSSRVPVLQQMCCLGFRVEYKFFCGLYLDRLFPEMPQRLASEAQLLSL